MACCWVGVVFCGVGVVFWVGVANSWVGVATVFCSAAGLLGVAATTAALGGYTFSSCWLDESVLPVEWSC